MFIVLPRLIPVLYHLLIESRSLLYVADIRSFLLISRLLYGLHRSGLYSLLFHCNFPSLICMTFVPIFLWNLINLIFLDGCFVHFFSVNCHDHFFSVFCVILIAAKLISEIASTAAIKIISFSSSLYPDSSQYFSDWVCNAQICLFISACRITIQYCKIFPLK